MGNAVLGRILAYESTFGSILAKENTIPPHYNAPQYSAVFILIRPCHGSQNDSFAICLL